MPEGTAIQSMFSGIAGRYDFANHFLSGGTDYYWRKILVHKVKTQQPQIVVDLATGSGDVAFALQKKLPASVEIKGLDFCQPMLDEAEKKKTEKGDIDNLSFGFGDCMALPLEDNTADAVTIAFGVRNFEDRSKGLKEIHRILKPGGKLYILEFSQPYTWFKPFYYLYLKLILPIVAGLTTGKKDAYQYLAGSIEEFPKKEVLAEQVEAAGFSNTKACPLTFCIVAIHEAEKAQEA